MSNFLRPLGPLSGSNAAGLTSDTYGQLRNRQRLAEQLTQGAGSPEGAGGSFLGALAQGMRGFAGAQLQRQNASDINAFAQASPLAAGALQSAQPHEPVNPIEGMGRAFDRVGGLFGLTPPQQPAEAPPDPNGWFSSGMRRFLT